MKCLIVLLCVAVASASHHARSYDEREGYQEDPFNDMRAFQDANRVVSKDFVTLLQRPVERTVSELIPRNDLLYYWKYLRYSHLLKKARVEDQVPVTKGVNVKIIPENTTEIQTSPSSKNDDVKHNFSTLLARCYVVTSFCNIWWHHFETFDDIILNDLHILDFE